MRDTGFELEIQIPIFDGGEARVMLASETYMQAVNRLLARGAHAVSGAGEGR